MNIAVLGLGEVGFYLSQELIKQGHFLSIFETNPVVFQKANELLDAKIIQKDGSLAQNLKTIPIADIDLFLSLSSDDKTNIIACSIAKKLGAKQVIARIHSKTYQEKEHINYQLHFNIDRFLDPERLCALEIAKRIHPFDFLLIDQFLDESIQAEQVAIESTDKWHGKKVKDLPAGKNWRVAYIIKNKKLFIPNENTHLENGDTLALVGTAKALKTIRNEFSFKLTHYKHLNLVIYGANEFSLSLIQLLKKPFYKIRLIEKNIELCEEFAIRFPEITVLNEDATYLKLLQEEDVANADFFIACTKDDENNIMTALQTEKLGTKRVEVLVNSTNYELLVDDLRNKLGIDAIHSPRIYTLNAVSQYIKEGPYMDISNLHGGNVKIVELPIGQSSVYKNKTIHNANLPDGCQVLALVRDFEQSIPSQDSLIVENDRLILIAQESALDALQS